MMSSGENSGEIIILSDDDDDDDKDPENDLSCLIVEMEEVKKTDCVSPPCTLQEDVIVTFSRRADVLPHARYDCPVHPFTPSDCDTNAPVASNQLICDQCFCYICDKLASSCAMWSCSGACHCNSHKKSDFWNNIRNCELLGELKIFNLTLSEVDSHLRQAEMMLQNFRQELCTLFPYLKLGETPLQDYSVDQQGFVPNYTSVFEFVLSFLNKADKQDSRAAAILNLGAAQHFIRHFQVSGPTIPSLMAFLPRVITSVQRLMVMADLAPDFIYKLQDFYLKRITLPVEMKGMRNRLCVRPWDDILLVSVLKGQNVSGIRKDKGKKDVLTEQISVVLLRTELLQKQCRYRELCRYLRVVQTDDSELFQMIQDLMPFFLCMEGDFTSALTSLFPSVNSPSIRFTSQLFLFYLHIFKTATAPKLIVSHPGQLCCSAAAWEPIKDAVPLKHVELVKFALRALRCSPNVYTDCQCWSSLLTIVNSPSGSLTALPEPNPQFLHGARDVVNSILLSQQGSNMQIPRSFLEVYPDQALLLLVTGALGFKILNSPLRPALPVLSTFKDNLWAFHWLCEGLSSHGLRLESLSLEIAQEVANTTGHPLTVKLDFSPANAPSKSN
ncbi:uncharacterized protein zgc:112980 isoform X2 [Melanotaenia boesemani]|uniref:uncharacterized protein zgc:112980 isoform X2 n=1 Tax=Melanotaenia boesemani TaxID=1250792 RepID=UPI001C03D4EB|nr:uncharacterized protein zgc:112980 isoform X2 [Melanotaenia boesemani]